MKKLIYFLKIIFEKKNTSLNKWVNEGKLGQTLMIFFFVYSRSFSSAWLV